MSCVLVSLDVGGTLGRAVGRSLATILVEASPLPPEPARAVVRRMLHTTSSITPTIVAQVCDALRIPASAFPSAVTPAPLQLLPEALPALQAMSQHAKLVTLSNVTCLEADTDHLREMLHPWVQEHFPSYRIGYAKPDPSAFRHVAKACGVPVTQLVHIGDDWTCDVIGALSVGATVIWISHGLPLPVAESQEWCNVLVAPDLGAASAHVRELTLRRRS